MRNRSLLEQLDRQNVATCTLLPFVSALPFVDDEVLVATFGQTMATRNFLEPIAHLLKEMPEIELPHLEAFLFPSHPKEAYSKRATCLLATEAARIACAQRAAAFPVRIDWRE